MLKNLLMMTKSIKVDLVPWNTFNLEYKSFNWTLSMIDQDTMEIDFFFENPLYIS